MATRSSAGTLAGGAKRGLKPPTASTKLGPVAEAGAQRRRAGDRELVGEPRIDQHRVDRGGAGVEVDDADRLEVEAHEVVVGRRQQRADAAEREQPRARRRTRGSAPGPCSTSVGVNQPILASEPEQVAAAPRRERARQRCGSAPARCRPDRAGTAASPACRSSGPARSTSSSKVRLHADHAADAEQREAQAQRNRAEVLGGDEDDQRVAAAAVGHARGDQAEGLERDAASWSESCITPAYRPCAASWNRKPPPAHHAVRVDRQPDARRRLEVECRDRSDRDCRLRRRVTPALRRDRARRRPAQSSR